jgi:hypothetical protein
MFTTLQELGAILSLALAGVFFRTVQQNCLEPHMDLISSSLRASQSEANFDSLLSNPSVVEQLLGSHDPVLSWIDRAFIAGYEVTFQFLLVSCVIATVLTCFLPKHRHPKGDSQ